MPFDGGLESDKKRKNMCGSGSYLEWFMIKYKHKNLKAGEDEPMKDCS